MPLTLHHMRETRMTTNSIHVGAYFLIHYIQPTENTVHMPILCMWFEIISASSRHHVQLDIACTTNVSISV